MNKRIIIIKGGPGSGHHGHSGRPGKRGGSTPSGGGGVEYDGLDRKHIGFIIRALEHNHVHKTRVAARAGMKPLGNNLQKVITDIENDSSNISKHISTIRTALNRWRTDMTKPGKRTTQSDRRRYDAVMAWIEDQENS